MGIGLDILKIFWSPAGILFAGLFLTLVSIAFDKVWCVYAGLVIVALGLVWGLISLL